ncbi:uncharacterized protein LOC117228838 [Megalopta genalis]|uniref:uncharacterized protein LOC117228838 n=1 Tax=Megalopta genalis TaxID=115081 RepID=UPI003FD21E60
MKTNAPYPTSPPAYSETMMTSPQPPPPPVPPPMPPYQYPPQHQPEPLSHIYNPSYPPSPWIPQQAIINPETSFIETPTAHNPSYQYNPTVVHVVADVDHSERLRKHQGCCVSCISLLIFVIIAAVMITFMVRIHEASSRSFNERS